MAATYRSWKKRPWNEETCLAGILILNFSASRTMRNECLWLSHLTYGATQTGCRYLLSLFSFLIPKDSPLLEEAGVR